MGPSGESKRALQKIAFLVFTPQQILLLNQIKDNEIGRACGTYEKTRNAILMEKPQRNLSQDLDGNGRIILNGFK